MEGRSRFLALAAMSGVFAACSSVPADVEGPGASPSGPETLPAGEAQVHETWFVELEHPPTARGGDAGVLGAEKARFRTHLQAAGIPVRERYSFDRLWNGVSL